MSQDLGPPRKLNNNASQRREAPAIPRQAIAFVNLTDSSGPTQDAEKRKLVRVHVMRGYQKQKQTQGAEDSQAVRLDRYEDGHVPLALTNFQPAVQSQSNDGFHIIEPRFSSAVEWDPSPDYRSNQILPQRGRVSEQQIGEKWLPVSVVEIQDDQPPAMNIAYDFGNSTFGLDQYDTSPCHVTDQNPQDLSQYFEQPPLVSEAIECPLISQSLSLGFNSLNSGMLDPFNAMPGLRNARAQALMYHCKQSCQSSASSVMVVDASIR